MAIDPDEIDVDQLLEDVMDGRVKADPSLVVKRVTPWPLLPREQQQVAVRLPTTTVTKLDERAEAKGLKRAALIRQVIDDYLASP